MQEFCHSLKKNEFSEAVKRAADPDNTERKQNIKFCDGLIEWIDLVYVTPATTDELAQREIGQQSGAGLFFCFHGQCRLAPKTSRNPTSDELRTMVAGGVFPKGTARSYIGILRSRQQLTLRRDR